MTQGVTAPLEELVALRARVLGHPFRDRGMPGGMSGARATGRRGRGMEFAESRPYHAGDDIRHIDWRQTARRGTAYTKLFREEHERPVQLVIDLGASMRFGTRCAFKSVVAARAAALLAWQASVCGERVGGIVCGGTSLREVRPQGREHGVLGLLREIAESAQCPPLAGQGLPDALQALGRTLRPCGVTILLSDFTALDDDLSRAITAFALRTEIALVHVHDAFEAEAPPPGVYPLCDGECSALLDLRSAQARASHVAPFEARCSRLAQLARSAPLRVLSLATHDAPERVLQLLAPSDT